MQNFDATGLNEGILKAISDLGFETLTPIQEKTIPHLLNNTNDLIGLAQTGTGKTAAFGLPIVQLADQNSKNTQALVLCPTRELCMQISRDFESFLKYQKHLKIVSVYGGASIDAQVRELNAGAQIVVGTPGRVHDLIRRKKLKVENIRWLVLDEADEMLNMGFRDELDAILENTPKERQTLLFSATMPSEISNIAKRYMNNPEEISAGKKNIGADMVEHFYYMINARDRYIALKRVLDINPDIYAIVFCRTRIETKDVAEKLMQDNYNADALHGDLSQPQRDYVMNRFRSRSLQVLVATDVAARGLDVNDLTHVINYNLPDESEIYLHRTGRTGRAGKTGIAISLIHSRETNRIRNIERVLGKKLTRKMVPAGEEICEKQLFALIDRMEKVEVDESQIEPYMPAIYKKLEWLSREDLIKHFVLVEFNRFLDYYKNAPDINIPEKGKGRQDDYADGGYREERRDRSKRKTTSDRYTDRTDAAPREERRDRSKRKPSSDGFTERTDKAPREERRDRRSNDSNFTNFFINIGSKHNLNILGLIGMINDNSHVRNIEIGKIEILRNFSFFEADSNYEKDILKGFKNLRFEGVPVVVDIKTGMERTPEEKKFNKKKNKDKKNKSARQG